MCGLREARYGRRMPTATIALLGSRDQAFTEGALLDERDQAKRWSERPKIELEVGDDETVGSILKRAGDALEVKAPWAEPRGTAPVPISVGLFDDSNESQAQTYSVLTLVDDDGRAVWNVPYGSVTFKQLRSASQAGIVSGDPTKLYYVVYPGIGNGLVATWEIIQTGLIVLYALMQAIATAEDNIGFAQRVINAARGRIGEGREVIERNASTWKSRGGEQSAVRQMLGSRPWHTADLAERLDCSEPEAEALLWGFGYAKDSAGLWRSEADEAASIVSATVGEIDLAYSLGHDDFEETLDRRVRHYLTKGELPPRPYLDEARYGDEKLIEREIEEKRRERGVGDGEEDDDERDDFELDDEEDLPLKHLLMACACGKDDCAVVARFGISNGRLKIGFTAATDHFVVEPLFMGQVAVQIAESIEMAKEPDDA